MSPKNQSELQAIADSMSVERLKIQKVFDVRWAFSSYSTDYLTISGFTSLNGLICLHSVLDKAGSQSVFKRTPNPRIFIHSFIGTFL